MRVPRPILGAFVVAAIVSLNIAVALLLDWLAHWGTHGLTTTAVAIGLAGVAAVNAVRFGAWWVIHRRMDLSRSAPLTAAFFPALLLTDMLRGLHPSWAQILGIVAITIGAAWSTTIEPRRTTDIGP